MECLSKFTTSPILHPVDYINSNNAFSKVVSHIQNEDDAVDIYQQTIIRAFEGLPKLNDPKYFSTWITRILINCSKTYISKRKNIVLVEAANIENLRTISHSIPILKNILICGRPSISLMKNIKPYSYYAFIRTIPSVKLLRFYNVLKVQ
jgi:hypothetical protein